MKRDWAVKKYENKKKIWTRRERRRVREWPRRGERYIEKESERETVVSRGM